MIPPAAPETISAMGSGKGRLGRGWRQLRSAPCTWMLVGILVLIQLIPVAWDMIQPEADKLTWAQEILGLTEKTFFAGRFWQIFTHAFIHANWLHLLANLACIILLGSKLEHIIPKRSFWLLVLFSCIAGGLMFLLFTAAVSVLPDELPPTLVGSSAICFGFLVLLTTLSPDSKFLPLFLSGRIIGVAIILTNLILALLNPDLPTGAMAGYGRMLVDHGMEDLFKISHSCHLGGSLAGFLYGKWLLRPRVTLKSLQKARAKIEAKQNSPH